MSDKTSASLKAAQEKESDLYSRLDEITDEWAKAEQALRIAEIEKSLQIVERNADNEEEINALQAELDSLRGGLPKNEEEVLKGGEVVTDIPWQNGETVHYVYVWSLCTKSWVLFIRSHWEIGRVCGAIGTLISKCYGGDFQLMRYKGKLFWVRKRPITFIRKGGPAGGLMATIVRNYIRRGTAAGIVASIHENFVRIGAGGYIIATVDGNYVRRGGPAGLLVATIDGNLIRSGGPAGVVIYAIDGEASTIEKGGLAAAALLMDGILE